MMMMMMMMHQMWHDAGTGAGSHSGRQQRRFFLQTGMHSRLHRLVQAKHHRFRFQRRRATRVERTIEDARPTGLLPMFCYRLRGILPIYKSAQNTTIMRVRPYGTPKSLLRLDAFITENFQKQSVFATTHAVASGVSLTREKPEVAYKRLDDDGDAGARFGACIGPEGRPQPTNQNGRLMNIDVGCRGNGAAAAVADADSDRRRATRGVACQHHWRHGTLSRAHVTCLQTDII